MYTIFSVEFYALQDQWCGATCIPAFNCLQLPSTAFRNEEPHIQSTRNYCFSGHSYAATVLNEMGQPAMHIAACNHVHPSCTPSALFPGPPPSLPDHWKLEGGELGYKAQPSVSYHCRALNNCNFYQPILMTTIIQYIYTSMATVVQAGLCCYSFPRYHTWFFVSCSICRRSSGLSSKNSSI